MLSRFDLTETQATRYYQQTERTKAGIVLSDSEILRNPYLVYEADRTEQEPLSLGSVNRGLFPDADALRPSVLLRLRRPGRPLDPRRVRALLVQELEHAAGEGHALQARATLMQKVRDRELRPPCPIGEDAVAVFEDTLSPEVVVTTMADDSPALQLQRFVETRQIIRSEVLKRVKGRPHDLDFEWRRLVDAALPGFDHTPEEEMARQEKAAALEQLYRSRFSVLIGPAGTGKTTLLKVLCEQPDVKAAGSCFSRRPARRASAWRPRSGSLAPDDRAVPGAL